MTSTSIDGAARGRGEASSAGTPRVILLTRVACHLCGPARDVVADVCGSRGLPWQEITVDSDPDLRAEYGDQVPVVLVDGEQVGTYGIDADELRAALDHGV